MDDLWQVVAELALALHPDRVAAAATRIESLGLAEEFALAWPSFGPSVDRSMLARLGAAWRGSGEVRPREIAAALRGASAAAALEAQRASVELVWTGPSTGAVPIRHTEQVLCEVIESARTRLFLVSFVAYEVGQINMALNDAVARRVRVDVLLESSTEQGGRVTVDSVKMIRQTVPSANVYVWKADVSEWTATHPIGAVHAKCAVADGRLAFVTSANLSPAAMERNMELGVLVRGGHLPDQLHRHLEALVTTETVERA